MMQMLSAEATAFLKANAGYFSAELDDYLNDRAGIETVRIKQVEDQLLGEIMDALGPLGRTFCECLYPSRDSPHLAVWEAAQTEGALDA